MRECLVVFSLFVRRLMEKPWLNLLENLKRSGLNFVLFFLFIHADSVGSTVTHRGEGKTPGRRTSAPPVVNAQAHQQRALLREKSKENQLDRNGYQQLDKDLDKNCFDIGQ